MEFSGQIQTLSALRPGKIVPCTHWIARWVVLGAGLIALLNRENSTPPGNELQFSGRPLCALAIILTQLFWLSIIQFNSSSICMLTQHRNQKVSTGKMMKQNKHT
jgi:hypothetical protein